MATFMNVFVDTDQSVVLIAPAISAILAKELVVAHLDVGDIYRTHLIGVDVDLYADHGLVDDRDMNFSRYAIKISLGPLWGERFHDKLVRALALDLAWQIHQRLKRPTMVTYDVDMVIHRFGA